MIGVVRKNNSRKLFISRSGQLVAKAPGNINQSDSETDDFVQGPIGDNYYTDAAKYNGGNRTDIANYESPSHIQRDNF